MLMLELEADPDRPCPRAVRAYRAPKATNPAPAGGGPRGRWLEELVRAFGRGAVAHWQEAPEGWDFESWDRRRRLELRPRVAAPRRPAPPGLSFIAPGCDHDGPRRGRDDD
jgi:hypothetical protein